MRAGPPHTNPDAPALNLAGPGVSGLVPAFPGPLSQPRSFAGDGNCPLGGISGENFAEGTLSTPVSIPNEGQRVSYKMTIV